LGNATTAEALELPKSAIAAKLSFVEQVDNLIELEPAPLQEAKQKSPPLEDGRVEKEISRGEMLDGGMYCLSLEGSD